MEYIGIFTTEPYMATLMPLSDANGHMCLSHHGRVVMLLKRKVLT